MYACDVTEYETAASKRLLELLIIAGYEYCGSQHDSTLIDQMYCTISEVEHLLQGLEVSKACGPDKISAQMLKYTASSIAPSVTKLFNISIRLGRIPDCWKEAMIA